MTAPLARYFIRVQDVPLIDGLEPVTGLTLEEMTLLARLPPDQGLGIPAAALVPKFGSIEVHGLDGKTPAEVGIAALLERVEGERIERQGLGCIVALRDLFLERDAYDSQPGMALSRVYEDDYLRCYLYRANFALLKTLLASVRALPDLILCTDEKWALGIDNDSGDEIAVGRWSSTATGDFS